MFDQPQDALAKARALFVDAVELLETGEAAAAEALLREALTLAPQRPSILNNLCLALIAQNRHAEAEPLARRACELDPDSAAAWQHVGLCHAANGDDIRALEDFTRALGLGAGAEVHRLRATSLARLGRHAEALTDFDAALVAFPDDAGLHNTMGNSLLAMGDTTRALAAYRQAVARAPDEAVAHSNLGNAWVLMGRASEGLASALRATQLQPTLADAWFTCGNARVELGDEEAAVADFDRAIALADAHPERYRMRWNRALALLQKGDFAAGWPAFECRWERPEACHQLHPDSPLWLGDAPLAGRTILLVSEQGLGDAIQFSRYAPRLAAAGAHVLLTVEAPLVNVLSRVDGIAQVTSKTDPVPPHDLHIPLMSLPLACRTDNVGSIPAATPYLRVDPARAARHEAALSTLRQPRIGLVWSGNPAHINDRQRSMALRELTPLMSLAATLGVSFVSLQKEVRATDLATLRGMPVHDMSTTLNDFDDTAAVIEQLDLVISVDTAVAHLAAALGKPVWLLLPHVAEWRWLKDREDSPWYPTMRLFRQTTAGDWAGVMGCVAQGLHARFGTR